MFSFRTTPIEDQLDRGLTDGQVGVLCSETCWNPELGKYTYEIFSQRGNLKFLHMPQEGHIFFDSDELSGVDSVVVDIQDIGCRYFPYSVDVLRLVSTLCSLEKAPSLYIVDHINPSGRDVEGTLPAGETDVWTPDVVHRHGLTLGELVHLYHSELSAQYPLHIISASASVASRTLLPWVIPPSDDVAGMFTSFFYPGTSLFTETNINPGIGTYRPYEIIGSPFLRKETIPCPEGLLCRPCTFTPEHGMYAGENCFGYQFILTPGQHYNSFLHSIQLLRYFSDNYKEFRIQESLFTRLADPVAKEYIQGNISFDIVEDHVKYEEQKWIRKARRFVLYDDTPVRIK